MLTKPGIPIIFFQVGDYYNIGYTRFLDTALCQATLAAPDSNIILLTDEIRPLPFEVIQVLVNDYAKGAAEFEKSYVHTSVNHEQYELHCFTRWFVIQDFVRKNKVERFCVFDSDILVFSPVEKFAAEFVGYAAGNWAWANYFSDMRAIDAMCDYFHRVFRDREMLTRLAEQYGRPETGQPHLSDMYLLFDLAKSNPLFLDQSGFPYKGYDNNIRVSLNGYYVMDGGIKLLTVGANRIPSAVRSADGTKVPFHLLHFQGQTKFLMGKFAWKIPPGSESAFLFSRNWSCPCTSGKRYKHCHGRDDLS